MPNKSDLLILGRGDVAQLLAHDGVLQCVERAFMLHSTEAGRVFPLVREFLPGGAVFGIKSGDISGDKVLGLKAAGFWPGNTALGKEAHQATILLLDPDTGRALAVFDGNHVTTMRTGAAGAVGLQLLSRANSKRLCLFGTGVQAAIQLDFALRARPSIGTVTYLTVNGTPDLAFEARFRERCDIAHAADSQRSVADADIVVTATSGKVPLFRTEAVSPGTHINAVGADTKGKRELPEGLLAKAIVFVDDLAQARQVGETQWRPESDVVEIGTLLAKTSSFTRQADDITVFDMTGLALQDLVVADFLYKSAVAQGSGQRYPWPW